MSEEHKRKTGPYLLLAIGLALLAGGVFIAIVAQVPGVSGGLMIIAALLLGRGAWKLRRQQPSVSTANGDAMPGTSETESPRRLEELVGQERQLLLAVRDNGGGLTPAEAAMNTTLTVREADRMLSELAKGGHLSVESERETLVYTLPERSVPRLAGQG